MNFYQIHIYTVEEIISTYYNPKFINIDEVRAIVSKMESIIQQKTNGNLKITLFEKNGKFMFFEDKKLIYGELCEFNKEKFCFVIKEDNNDFFSFIGETKADEFIKKGLIAVGAEELYSEIEPMALEQRRNQDRINADYIKWRELNQTTPLLKLELYRIEKNYIPRLIQESTGYSYESILFLPENKYLLNLDERTTFLLREIATNKVVEGSLREAIEYIKDQKYFRKYPPIMDPVDMMRMELDNDDPNFLSWDDYVANDDEHEEGDDEYSPNF
jgi:hypothetical protein